MSWIDAGEYEQREWSLEERGFERGKMLVQPYRATNGDSSKSVTVEQLKQLGGWTFEELDNLLDPLYQTGIIGVRMPFASDERDVTRFLIGFSRAQVNLTPTGVLATEDGVTQARQRPGYSVTIQGNNNQVQFATFNSEQLRNT
jgi:hypothetical protein